MVLTLKVGKWWQLVRHRSTAWFTTGQTGTGAGISKGIYALAPLANGCPAKHHSPLTCQRLHKCLSCCSLDSCSLRLWFLCSGQAGCWVGPAGSWAERALWLCCEGTGAHLCLWLWPLLWHQLPGWSICWVESVISLRTPGPSTVDRPLFHPEDGHPLEI